MGSINEWTTNETTHNFEPSLDYCNFLIDIGFGQNCSEETRLFWQKTIQANYGGDDGRRRARMAAINLRERDGLHGRLGCQMPGHVASRKLDPPGSLGKRLRF
jgi:hypothetical protein